MNWDALWPPLLALAAAAGGLAYMAVQLRRARLIEDTPTARIRSAPQGYVELAGFARAGAGEPLRSPLTRQPCVWFRYRIERYHRGGKGARWETVESGSSTQWFELDDHSGRCHVDPRGAEVTAILCTRWTGSSRLRTAAHGAPPDALLPDRGLGGLFAPGKEYRYTEWRIPAGAWLYALGQFETRHGPGHAERAQARTRAQLNRWKQDREELLGRFDRNGDGDVDLAEWEEARRAAARMAQAQVLQEPPAPAISVLRRPPDRSRPYLIAATDPERLARRHRWQAAAGLAAGAAVAAMLAVHHLRR